MQRSVTGLPIDTLIGIIGHVASPVVAGDTTIQLGIGNETLDTTLGVGSQITVFDGATSEQLLCTGPIDAPSSTVPIQPAQYNHALGIEYCTDGSGGSLADILVRASSLVEDYCNQSLLLQTRTDVLQKRWGNSDIARDGGLKILPTYWPVANVLSWSLQYEGIVGQAFPVDASMLVINPSTSSVLLPYVSLIQSLVLYGDEDIGVSSMSTFGNGRGFLSTLVYQSGYSMQNLPANIQRATILYACVELMQSKNSVGAQSIQEGKVKVSFFGTSDTSGISAFEKQAESYLKNYKRTAHVR